MKRLLLVSAFPLTAFSQMPYFNSVPNYLDKNGVKAGNVIVNSKSRYIGGNLAASYEAPKGKGTHGQFAGPVWIGGYDRGNALQVSANTCRQTGAGFWPGPLDTVNVAVCTYSNTVPYHQLWKAECNDIVAIVTAYVSGAGAAIPDPHIRFVRQGSLLPSIW